MLCEFGLFISADEVGIVKFRCCLDPAGGFVAILCVADAIADPGCSGYFLVPFSYGHGDDPPPFVFA